MLIHTPHPEKLMAQVEQNFVKKHFSKTQPLTLQLSSPESSMSTFKSTLLNCNKFPFQASAFIEPQAQFSFSKQDYNSSGMPPTLREEIPSLIQKTPLLPPVNPQQMVALLSMLYSLNPGLAAARSFPSFLGPRMNQQFSNIPNQPVVNANSTMLEQVDN